MLTAKIQELVDHHVANWPKNEQNGDKNASIDTLDNMCAAGGSRKTTDSSETLDKDYVASEDDSQYGNMAAPSDGNIENGNEVCCNVQHKFILEMKLLMG